MAKNHSVLQPGFLLDAMSFRLLSTSYSHGSRKPSGGGAVLNTEVVNQRDYARRRLDIGS